MKTWSILSLALMASILSGCMTVGPPSSSAEKSITKGEKTIVLFRGSAEIGGSQSDFTLQIADMSQAEPLIGVRPAAPSSDSRLEGWRYLILQPGETYFLRPGVSYSPIEDLWFHVPSNRQIVYIGTLTTSCKKRSLFAVPVPYARLCSSLSITDETDAAKEVAKNRFPNYGELSTSLVQPWPLPINPEIQFQPAANFGAPLTLDISSVKSVNAPHWYEQSFDKTMFLVNPGGGSGVPGLILIAAELAYLPVGLTLGAAGGAHSKSKWQPCVDRLSEELINFDYAKHLESAITDALLQQNLKVPPKVTTQISAKDRPGLTLQSSLNKIALAECKKDWSFFVDTSVQASLFLPDNQSLLYHRVFGKLNYDQYQKVHFPYLSILAVDSPCKKIEEYCSDSGPGIVRKQVIEALDAVAQQIAEDLVTQHNQTEW